ncbi:MAG: CbiX/SirB N-terminal domain-containing protein, partial [Phycisphaerae bacterium]
LDDVVAAFNHGAPAYADVLDQLEADEVTVVPFMTSAGYFSDVVLPRELAKNKRYTRLALNMTAPIGTHPVIADIVAQRVNALQRTYDLDQARTSLAVVGHGTERYERSRSASITLARRMREFGVAREAVVAFLDEEPHVETILQLAHYPCVIVVPFLIGAGLHAATDIPARIGIHARGVPQPPVRAQVASRIVICDAAIGTLPAILQAVDAVVRESR